jgi:hypothetical protein
MLIASIFYLGAFCLPCFSQTRNEKPTEVKEKALKVRFYYVYEDNVMLKVEANTASTSCLDSPQVPIQARNSEIKKKITTECMKLGYYVFEDDILEYTFNGHDIEGLSDFQVAKDVKIKDKKGNVIYIVKAGDPIQRNGNTLSIPLQKVK